MSFVPDGAGEGTFNVLANITQGEGSEEEPRTGVVLIDYSQASQASEQGWTGAGPLVPLTTCSVRADARGGRVRVAGAGNGSVLVLEAGKIEQESGVETYSEVFGFGPGGKEECGKPTVTAPRIEIGEETNASEVEVGKTVTVSSTVHSANALRTEWKLKYKTNTGEEGEEKGETGYQHRQPGLSHAFSHVGEYEITETVHTDCLGEPTVSATRKGLKVKPALNALKSRLLPFASVPARESATLEAEVADEDEQPQHLKYKWSFGDGTTQDEETPKAGVSGNAKLNTHHVYSVPGVYEVSLEVEDADGSKATVVTGQITVGESKEEIEQHKKEAEEKAAKEVKEAKEKQEAEAATAAAVKKHQEEEAAAAAAAKKMQEEEAAAAAAKKKQEEEAKAKAKPPTRAQLLAKALKTCKKQPKKKRANCEATARKKYGQKKKKKK